MNRAKEPEATAIRNLRSHFTVTSRRGPRSLRCSAKWLEAATIVALLVNREWRASGATLDDDFQSSRRRGIATCGQGRWLLQI